MHGLSMMQGLLDAVARNASEKGILKVKLIHITVGGLSGVSCEELQFAYSLIAQGSMFENATLEIEPEPDGRELRIDFYEAV